VPKVSDKDLARAVITLHEHVVSSGYFGERMDGMSTIRDERTGVEAHLAPNRKKVPSGRSVADVEECVLCEDTDPLERRMTWRDYWVRPNAYPYVPEDAQHMLVLPTRHQPQSFSPKLLGDMIDYQRMVGGERKLTMFYNGLAGNSQFHLHWQAMHRTVPLERDLDLAKVPLTPLRWSRTGAVQSFEGPLRSGFIVEGDKAYVTKWTRWITNKLDHDPLTSVDGAGRYNLMLLSPRDGRTRLVVFPRYADARGVDLGERGKFGVGAVNLAGMWVVPKPSISEDFFEVVPQAAGKAAVPPSALSWTRELAAAPESSLLALRAA